MALSEHERQGVLRLAAAINRRNARQRPALEQALVRRVKEAHREVSRLVERFREADPELRSVVLFGSLARNEVQRIDFDIDLAVESDRYSQLLDIALESVFRVDLIDLVAASSYIKLYQAIGSARRHGALPCNIGRGYCGSGQAYARAETRSVGCFRGPGGARHTRREASRSRGAARVVDHAAADPAVGRRFGLISVNGAVASVAASAGRVVNSAEPPGWTPPRSGWRTPRRVAGRSPRLP